MVWLHLQTSVHMKEIADLLNIDITQLNDAAGKLPIHSVASVRYLISHR